MTRLETIIEFLSQVDVVWIYLIVLAIAWLENIFPPFPSDVVIVAAGSIISLGEGSVVLLVLAATVGSTLGFMSMYWLGNQFGDRMLETGRIKFISRKLVQKVHDWFSRFGYWVVIGNRFLSGTRAVISFCTGIADMHFGITSVLSALSALLWNSILIYAGYTVGDNWKVIGDYISAYSRIVTIVVTSGIVLWAIIAYIRWRRNKNGSAVNGGQA